VKVSLEAIHEAGHAVVAAHLRIPFTHVTIKQGEDKDGDMWGGYVRRKCIQIPTYSWNGKTDVFRPRSKSDLTRVAQKQITNTAIMILAARAAVNLCFNADDVPESDYEKDEELLTELFAYQQIDLPFGGTITVHDETNFASWRATLLKQAQVVMQGASLA
jgi:hypothetical protein